jgi:predicted enzyme related to lactoylglutathione lyase
VTSTLRSGAVIFANDKARVAQFYARVAHLRITHDGDDVTVLESVDMQLVIHPVPSHIAAQYPVASPPERREDTAIKLYFAVSSLADARRDAAALGGVVDPADREWEARGFRACDGHDPEGNVIQVRVAL